MRQKQNSQIKKTLQKKETTADFSSPVRAKQAKKDHTDEKKQKKAKKPGARVRSTVSVMTPTLPTGEEAARFLSAIASLSRDEPTENPGFPKQIGMLKEKSLHVILKRYLCSDASCYEKEIRSASNSSHSYIADIAVGNSIFEIQTGGFFPLKEKIQFYLTETDYDVTVVHPLPYLRYKVWIDPGSGEVISRRKSPKKGRAEDALKEIFWLSAHLQNPRFHVRLLFLEEEEYRYLDGWSADKKRGSNRLERFPVALCGSLELALATDYACFLPPVLPNCFTAAEFGACLGLSGRSVYYAIHTLVSAGLLFPDGKRNRAALFRRAQETGTES